MCSYKSHLIVAFNIVTEKMVILRSVLMNTLAIKCWKLLWLLKNLLLQPLQHVKKLVTQRQNRVYGLALDALPCKHEYVIKGCKK